jgi:hypothetical protein
MPTEATRAVPDRTPWQQRAVLAGTARHHGFNAPETQAARRDLAAVNLAAYIKKTVAVAPLTRAQADELALLLNGRQR